MKSEILTVSGNYFNFLDPDNSVYTVNDIAHSLSHINRFTGHTRIAYSVAQHAVLVSYLVPPEHALAALHHDDSEAFLGDVSSPLKQMLPEYKVIEERVERAIFAKFGIPFPLHPCIKHADLIMLVSEMHSLMPSGIILDGITPLEAKIKPWTSKVAKAKFIARHYELTKENV